MSSALSSVVAFAAGVALSPFPIVAIILVLFSRRARVNGPVFLAGWMVGLSVVVTVTFLLVDRLDAGGDAGSGGISWWRLLLGGVLLAAAWRKWRSGSDPADEREQPRWMSGVEESTPRQVAALSVALSFNPKNLALAAAAGATLGELEPSTAEAAIALMAFVLIGSAPVILAVTYHAVGGVRSTARLETARAWLSIHHAAMLATLYLVFGLLLISGGLGLR